MVAPFALLAGGAQTGITQHPQVGGQGGLRQAQRVAQFAHTQLGLGDRPEDAHPISVGQGRGSAHKRLGWHR